MDCFNNTCLACDRECEAHYCSQTCKLADIERGVHGSTSSSPTSPMVPIRSNSWQTPSQTREYVLEAAYSVSSFKNVANGSRQSQTAHFMSSVSTDASVPPRPTERSLTPSSSRSSLSSTTSSTAPGSSLSAQNNQQLQDYFNSFEKVRAAKRRSSLR